MNVITGKLLKIAMFFTFFLPILVKYLHIATTIDKVCYSLYIAIIGKKKCKLLLWVKTVILVLFKLKKNVSMLLLWV